MSSPVRSLLAVLPLLALAACATAPRTETTLAGGLPAGSQSYALVDGVRYFGPGDLPTRLLEQCLGAAGLTRGLPPEVLVQVSHAVRPAGVRVQSGGEADAARRRDHAGRDREALVLALTDPATGAVLLRASAARTLRRGERAGTGADLADTVCGLIRPAWAAGAAEAGSR